MYLSTRKPPAREQSEKHMDPNKPSFVPLQKQRYHSSALFGSAPSVFVLERSDELLERDRKWQGQRLLALQIENEQIRHWRQILPKSSILVENATFLGRDPVDNSVVLNWRACSDIDRGVSDYIQRQGGVIISTFPNGNS